MEVSSESPRVSPRDRVGDLPVFCARGVGNFAIHLCLGVGAFAIDINLRNFQMLTIFTFISSSTFYIKVMPFIELVFENPIWGGQILPSVNGLGRTLPGCVNAVLTPF